MCGILGRFSEKPAGEKFCQALDSIAHRGPDGFGIWVDENNKKITLGHRRLSIIDLSDNGKQPMLWHNRYVITFNGEIYNYIELKEDLQKKGVAFRTESDTEVLLALYAEEGASCLTKLNGMFAFAIYDIQEQTIFLARDRMGIKPLYYSNSNNEFIFASEMKAIYPFLKSVIPNYDLVKAASQDVFCYESTEHCLIDGIKRFPSASYGVFQNGKLSIHKWWNVLDNIQSVPAKYNDQVEQFKELFINSCKIRMRSDVPVGTALSGGIDSSATISTMAHVAKNEQGSFSRDWQHAFVASFPGTSLDETKEAKMVADSLGINATYVNIDPIKDIDKLFYYTYLFEDLFISSPLPFFQLYAQIKKSGTTGSLDGHGSDELFGGYPFELSHKLLDDFPNIFRMKQTIQTINDGSLNNSKATWYDVYPYFKNRTKKFLTNKLSTANGLDHLNTKLYNTTFKTILPTLLRNYDKYSMVNGVEIRMPFLDYRIVEFAFSIPSSSKIRNGYSKSIVRDAMKGFFPDEVRLLKKKTGFHTPFTDWLKGPLNEWVNDEMSSKDFSDSQFINPKEVSEFVNRVINNKNATFQDGEFAWNMLMPYVWGKSLNYIHKY